MELHYNNLILLKILRHIRFLLYIILIILLYTIDVDFIEGQSLCIIYNLFNIKCVTCGMTRALFNLSRGNFIKAINYNHLIIIILPILLYLIIEDLYKILFTKLNIKQDIKFSLVERIYYIMFIKFSA